MFFIDIFWLNPQNGTLNENKNNLFIDIFGLNPQIGTLNENKNNDFHWHFWIKSANWKFKWK